jgi:hypothetical protein
MILPVPGFRRVNNSVVPLGEKVTPVCLDAIQVPTPTPYSKSIPAELLARPPESTSPDHLLYLHVQAQDSGIKALNRVSELNRFVRAHDR